MTEPVQPNEHGSDEHRSRDHRSDDQRSVGQQLDDQSSDERQPLPGQAASDDGVAAAQTRVREAIAGLDAVRDASPQGQVEAFSAAHQTLQATLSDIDSD